MDHNDLRAHHRRTRTPSAPVFKVGAAVALTRHVHARTRRLTDGNLDGDVKILPSGHACEVIEVRRFKRLPVRYLVRAVTSPGACWYAWLYVDGLTAHVRPEPPRNPPADGSDGPAPQWDASRPYD